LEEAYQNGALDARTKRLMAMTAATRIMGYLEKKGLL